MNIISIIEKKKNNKNLTESEINYFIKNYCNNQIKDYQASSLLMAICLNGMNEKETYYLTKAMLNSGDQIKLGNGIFVDKHSTGGVGDKTSLVLVPMLAAANLKVAKMSGKGLGHTGGTLDKLESIPGYKINLSQNKFIKQVDTVGCSIIAQSKKLVLADKKLYALRDVTGTVDSLPLIASSIMSKKIASGASIILLDVKYGDGAFMTNKKQAKELAELMVKIGNKFKRKVLYELSTMNEPLGLAIGNNLEVKEAVNTLLNNGPKDLTKLCVESGAKLLHAASNKMAINDCKNIMLNILKDKSAYNKFLEMVEAQGGDISYLKNLNKFETCKNQIIIKSKQEGTIKKIYTKKLGMMSSELGAGRLQINDEIDYAAGIILNKKLKDHVKKNEKLCTIYTNRAANSKQISEILKMFVVN